MVKLSIVWTAFLLVVVMGVFGCAPPARQGLAPSTSTFTVAPAPATVAPTPSAEQAGWAQVLSEARKEGKLTVYAGIFGGDSAIALSRAFREKFSITLEIISGKGAEFIERIKTEQRMGQVVGDILAGSPTFAYVAKSQGILTNMSATLPVLQEKKDVWITLPQALDPEGLILVFSQETFGFYVNTNLVPRGTEPVSWQDLLDPKWKGKIVVLDPRISTNIYTFLLTPTEKGVLPAEFLSKFFAQDLILVRAEADALQGLANGKYHIFAGGTPSFAISFVRDGAPIKALDLREATNVSNLSISAIKGGPNPNASRVFLNWVLSSEGQSIVPQLIGMESIRKGMPSGVPPALKVSLQNPIILDQAIRKKGAKMFQDKAWVPFLVK